MYEPIKRISPIAHAEGHICIELKDPITGKVQHREVCKNYVFSHALLCGPSRDWVSGVSGAYMELTDSDEALDQTFPYMIGNTIGYGIPSTGSSGLLRGAYSVTNQVLAQKNGLTSLRWKFQYNFTPEQANGTIRRIGLTNQYRENLILTSAFPFSDLSLLVDTSCNDGRYRYKVSTAGIVTITDIYMKTTTTIDLSATVDTTNAKSIGYAPMTGKMYIYKYNSTAASRKMYVFSDNTFSTLETTYTPTNVAISPVYPFYVYGDKAFFVGPTSLKIADFVANTAYTTYTPTEHVLTAGNGLGNFNETSLGFKKYIMITGNSSAESGVLFDMSTQQQVGGLLKPRNASLSNGLTLLDPISAEAICGHVCGSDAYAGSNPAIAMKKLETPITKTSANGMTVTYELEVFW